MILHPDQCNITNVQSQTYLNRVSYKRSIRADLLVSQVREVRKPLIFLLPVCDVRADQTGCLGRARYRVIG